jgi:uncharacterized protein YbjT (DUF2867 family)
MSSSLYAVIGITGKVGGHCANTLLAANQRVRAVVRDATKGPAWSKRGCEVAVADVSDSKALTAALTGVDGAFILIPPAYDIQDFTTAHDTARSLKTALEAARPPRVVVLSTVGAQATQTNLLTYLTTIEQELSQLTIPITFLRAAWFMENSAWDVSAAKSGMIPSYLQPLDKPLPMVATADIGRVAAELLQTPWTGRRVVELEGPHTVTPNQIAEIFSKLLQKPVRTTAVPRDEWEKIFISQGMKYPTLRMQMLDGFNAGWLCFEGKSIKGTVPIETVLAGLISGSD